MKTIIRNRYFLLFILLFAYVQSIYTRISIRREINAYIFTPEAAVATFVGAGILFLILSFFIERWQREEVPSPTEILQTFGISVLSFVLIMQIIGFAIALAFDKIALNFSSESFTLSLFSDFLDAVIYGSFFLVYYYYNSSKKQQQKLVQYHQSLAESKISQLKAQLNPHFLFNNLNILDQLIVEDKEKASDFLNKFADIYRYVLQSTDKELVDIQEELDFAKQYFSLIQHKYEHAYQLHIEQQSSKGYIVPLALQLLIENAVQHNIGTTDRPVHIHLVLDDRIQVYNNFIPKRTSKPTSARALHNLTEQYRLLSTSSITIRHTKEIFSVCIPLITKLK